MKNCPRNVLLSILTILISASLANGKSEVLTPVPRPEKVWDNYGGETWMGRHEAILEHNRKKGVDLLFIGDSITHRWGVADLGLDVWQAVYAPRNAVNLGFGGDRIQHVLWRLDHGEIDGIHPRVAVVMIGTNNASSGDSHQAIAAGVLAVCSRLRAKLPQTQILLLGIFPRVKHTPEAGAEAILANRLMEQMHDGEWIHYLDIGDAFRDADGWLRKDLMPDGLHPNAAGYAAWAEAMRPVLSELLGEALPAYAPADPEKPVAPE